MGHIHVACAIIEDDGRILCAQRSSEMSMPLKWEFPGGKIKAGEDPEACVVREVREELGVETVIRKALPAVTHDYETFSVTLFPFVCTVDSGEITPHEHAAVAWLKPDELAGLDWAEADWPVIRAYRERTNRAGCRA
jgi:8-oxo-dGTP diphosphatase